MAETGSLPAHYEYACWETANWYDAATLAERIALLHAQTGTPSVQITEQARKQLQRWQEEYVFKQAISFAERLEMEEITEGELLTLLAIPTEALQASLAPSSYPSWLEELAQAFATPLATLDEALPYEPGEENTLPLFFVKPIEPLLRRTLARLYDGIGDLARRYSVLPFDTQSVTASLFAHLVWKLRSMLARTFVLELNIARVQQRLQGDTPEQRFLDFVRLLCQGEILTLLAEYPVLARQLSLAIEHWVHYGLEFLGHLCADWEELCTTFAPGTELDQLTAVRMGAGDSHRDGRSVMILTFHSGRQLVYKPKSLAIDVRFQELLTWLNECGCTPTLAILKVIDKGHYGWSEYIVARACASKEEVQRFYERQGAYLALLYALQATDVHFENVIAAGEHPFLIDLEALLHPDEASYHGSWHPAEKILRDSVLRVGLLPHRDYAGEEDAGIDVSGLGGQKEQLTPQPVTRWEQAGTDMMHAARRRVEMGAGQNLPTLNGQDVALLDYRDAIITGFMRMYSLLKRERDTLLQEFLPRFLSAEVRVILRPTRLYALLLNGSLHPDNVRDGLDRDRFLDRLFFGSSHWPQRSRIIAAERKALLRGDVPMFTTRPDSRDLFTCQGECIREFFRQPSYLSVQAHLQQLSEEDLQRQVWFIEASFTSLLVEAHQTRRRKWQTRRRKRQLQFSVVPATHERLLAAASTIGKQLSNRAIWDETKAGWLSITHINRYEWSIQAAGTDLYDGAAGIVLFLAYLGVLSGQTQYTILAKAALKTIQDSLEQQRQQSEKLRIGAFQGLSSLIYLLCHLGVTWNEPGLLQEGEALIALLPALIEKDKTFDIISGAAGCILTLLGFHRVTSSQAALAVASQCGQHLLRHACKMQVGVGWKAPFQDSPLAGFSHGAAGIAYSLLSLAAISGDERFKGIALEALAYERSLYVPVEQNWLDLRAENEDGARNSQAESKKKQKFMIAWCHGAPGIGLARLASLPYVDNAKIREEIQIACKTTVARGFGLNHSLCHGDMGNIETLLMAACKLDRPIYCEKVYKIAGMLLGESDTRNWVTGVPIAVETPGLMTGLAGIGYELLRLAEPEQVPSVLLLAPPYGSVLKVEMTA